MRVKWRFLACLTAASAITLAVDVAVGQPTARHACFSSHEQGQLLRNDGRLRRARAELLVCARDICPAPVRNECTQWIGEVDAAQPTIVLQVREADGRDLDDVRVLVDGEPLVDRLDGRPTAVDPGPHDLRFEMRDGRSEKQSVVIGVGEKDRRIVVQLAPRPVAPAAPAPPAATPASASARPPEPPPERASSAPVVVGFGLAGFGVLGLGSFALFAATGYHDEKTLADDCAPHCKQSDADAVQRRYVVADVSLAVGITALAVGAGILLAHRSRTRPASAAARASVGPAPVRVTGAF